MMKGIGRWAFIALLVALAIVSLPALVPIDAERERIDEPFTRCGEGRSFACVVDGDTIRLGSRRIRILGIDAPELAEPRCDEERVLAERAADELLDMLGEGPFELVRDVREDRDDYGRELRRIERGGVSLGDELIRQGLAVPYLGRKGQWCMGEAE